MQEKLSLSFKPENLGARPVHKYIPAEDIPLSDLETKTVDLKTEERVDQVYGKPSDTSHRQM